MPGMVYTSLFPLEDVGYCVHITNFLAGVGNDGYNTYFSCRCRAWFVHHYFLLQMSGMVFTLLISLVDVRHYVYNHILGPYHDSTAGS
jgi:hypothetical protein